MKITNCKVCKKNPGRRNVCEGCKVKFPYVASCRNPGSTASLKPFHRIKEYEKEIKRIRING